MRASTHIALLFLVDVLLGFAIFCVLPFAWILRDGLGPSSVRTTGVDAISKAFTTFYVGPAILLLVLFEILLRGSRDNNRAKPRVAISIATLALIAALAFLLILVIRN